MDGRVAWIAFSEDGSAPIAVEGGAMVVKMQGYKRVETNVTNLIKRKGHYQDRLDRAQAKGDKPAMEALQKKVEAKSAALGEEAKALAALTVSADASGDFTPSVKVGQNVKTGDSLGTLTLAPELEASFKVADPSPWVAGDEVSLKVKGSADTLSCLVAKSEAASVSVTCPPNEAVATGASVVLPAQ